MNEAEMPWRLQYTVDDQNRITSLYRTREERDESAVELIEGGSWATDVVVQSWGADHGWQDDILPDLDAPVTPVTLTVRQRYWLKFALSDAHAYRQQEDEDRDDFEDVDGPAREHAKQLYALFGWDPEYMG